MGLFKNDSTKTEQIFSKMISECVTASVKDIDSELVDVANKIDSYKGIVVYPEALDYFPLQRPQHILRVFAKKGYLCLFCVSNAKKNVYEVEKNLFIVKDQKRIAPLIKGRKTLFLINYFMQYPITEVLSPEDKMIWLDIIGSIEKYEYYNNFAIKIYKKLMEQAFLATYSNEKYKIYYDGVRKNIKLMQDGVMPEDFIKEQNVPNEAKKYVYDNKKTLCYYGNIDETIDFEYIKKLDLTNKYNILLIGKMPEDMTLKQFELHNTHVFNQIDYSNLKKYIPHFDLMIFPLKNDNSRVLYSKTLEATAMNLKIVSLDFDELRDLKFSNLYLFKTSEEILENIDKIIEEKDYEFDKKIKEEIELYKWDNVINKIL